MDSIGTAIKIAAMAAGLALALGGIYLASLWNARYGLVAPATQTAAAVDAAPSPGIFTGSLSYYDQQGRTVP
jgi:hypothetical protein